MVRDPRSFWVGWASAVAGGTAAQVWLALGWWPA